MMGEADHDAPEPGGTLFLGNVLQELQKAPIVVFIAGPLAGEP
jgi:hypothetical protein